MSQLFHKFGVLRKTHQDMHSQSEKYENMRAFLASDPVFAGSVNEIIDTFMTYSITQNKQEQDLGMIPLAQALQNSTMTIEQRWAYAEALL